MSRPTEHPAVSLMDCFGQVVAEELARKIKIKSRHEDAPSS
jgi:hypothetical protein